MKTLLIYSPSIACLAMALIICLPMLMKHGKHEPNSEVAQLKEEIARLRALIALRDDEGVSTSDG